MSWCHPGALIPPNALEAVHELLSHDSNKNKSHVDQFTNEQALSKTTNQREQSSTHTKPSALPLSSAVVSPWPSRPPSTTPVNKTIDSTVSRSLTAPSAAGHVTHPSTNWSPTPLPVNPVPVERRTTPEPKQREPSPELDPPPPDSSSTHISMPLFI